MDESQTQDYITDVEYTDNYNKNQEPVLLNYIAGINGRNPPDNLQQFNYCELACGDGSTLNILADANPESQFTGIDLNQAHIEQAKKIAQQGQLKNVTYLQKSFAELQEQDLPDFDYVTLHGVYSWISPELRRSIVEFIKQKLKPGGIVMLSYNAKPGKLLHEPLRDMMRAYTRNMNISPLDKARHGLSYLDFLIKKDARFFQDNPGAKDIVAQLKKKDMRYIAHEYFNEHWHPKYFSEVAAELQQANVSYAGQTNIVSNYRELSVPQNIQEELAKSTDRISFETHKSFILNDSFRHDVFYKPLQNQSTEATEKYLEHFAYCSFVHPERFNYQYNIPAGRLNLAGDIFAPLIKAIYAAPQTIEQLQQQEALQNFSANEIAKALQSLILTEQVRPVAITTVTNNSLHSSLNQYLLQHKNAAKTVFNLSANRTGGGLQLTYMETVMLQATLSEDTSGEKILDVIQQIIKNDGRVVADVTGKAVKDKDKEVKMLAQVLEEFENNQLPVIKSLMLN